MLQRLNNRQMLSILFLIISILVTALFWIIAPFDIGGAGTDYHAFYAPVAKSLLAGNGFTASNGDPAVRYPPGYPIILATLFGISSIGGISTSVVLLIFAMLCMGLSTVFLFWLAQSVHGVLGATLAALLWMTYPFALWLTMNPNSEVPFLAFFLGSFCLFWYALVHQRHEWHFYFLVGLLVGISMLIRPIAIGLGMVFSLILWINLSEMRAYWRVRLIGVLLLGSLIMVLPWQLWLSSQTDRVVLLSTGSAPSIRDGLTFATNLKGFRQGVDVPEDVAVLSQAIQDRYNELESPGAIVAVVATESQLRPLALVQLIGIKALRSWYATDSQRYEIYTLLIQLVYLMLIVPGSWAMWRRGGLSRKLLISIGLIILYFWGMTILVLSILRYMVPVVSLLFLLAPGCLDYFKSWTPLPLPPDEICTSSVRVVAKRSE